MQIKLLFIGFWLLVISDFFVGQVAFGNGKEDFLLPKQSMVLVISKDKKAKVGNGIIVSPNGHVLTVSHVLDKNAKFTIVAPDNKRYPAKIIFNASNKELAILKIMSTKNWPAATLVAAPKRADKVMIATRDTGHIERIKRKISTVNVSKINFYTTKESRSTWPIVFNGIVVQSRVDDGDSGGGLYNKDGELVGLTVSTATRANNKKVTLALFANQVKPILDLELEGLYSSNQDKLNWFLDGLVNAYDVTKKSKAELLKVKRKVQEQLKDKKSNTRAAWNKMSDLAWTKLHKLLKNSNQH